MKPELNADEIRSLLVALDDWERVREEPWFDEAELVRARVKLTEMLRAATPADGQAHGEQEEAGR